MDETRMFSYQNRRPVPWVMAVLLAFFIGTGTASAQQTDPAQKGQPVFSNLTQTLKQHEAYLAELEAEKKKILEKLKKARAQLKAIAPLLAEAEKKESIASKNRFDKWDALKEAIKRQVPSSDIGFDPVNKDFFRMQIFPDNVYKYSGNLSGGVNPWLLDAPSQEEFFQGEKVTRTMDVPFDGLVYAIETQISRCQKVQPWLKRLNRDEDVRVVKRLEQKQKRLLNALKGPFNAWKNAIVSHVEVAEINGRISQLKDQIEQLEGGDSMRLGLASIAQETEETKKKIAAVKQEIAAFENLPEKGGAVYYVQSLFLDVKGSGSSRRTTRYIANNACTASILGSIPTFTGLSAGVSYEVTASYLSKSMETCTYNLEDGSGLGSSSIPRLASAWNVSAALIPPTPQIVNGRTVGNSIFYDGNGSDSMKVSLKTSGVTEVKHVDKGHPCGLVPTIITGDIAARDRITGQPAEFTFIPVAIEGISLLYNGRKLKANDVIDMVAGSQIEVLPTLDYTVGSEKRSVSSGIPFKWEPDVYSAQLITIEKNRIKAIAAGRLKDSSAEARVIIPGTACQSPIQARILNDLMNYDQEGYEPDYSASFKIHVSNIMPSVDFMDGGMPRQAYNSWGGKIDGQAYFLAQGDRVAFKFRALGGVDMNRYRVKWSNGATSAFKDNEASYVFQYNGQDKSLDPLIGLKGKIVRKDGSPADFQYVYQFQEMFYPTRPEVSSLAFDTTDQNISFPLEKEQSAYRISQPGLTVNYKDGTQEHIDLASTGHGATGIAKHIAIERSGSKGVRIDTGKGIVPAHLQHSQGRYYLKEGEEGESTFTATIRTDAIAGIFVAGGQVSATTRVQLKNKPADTTGSQPQVTDVKIVDIHNISGHNPLNTDNPVLNTDGQTYDTPQALKDCVDNNNCTTGSGSHANTFTGCNSAFGRIEGASTNGGFILFKDPTTGECEKALFITYNDPVPAAPAGMTEAFRITNPESGTQAAGTVKLATNAGSGYTMFSPPAGAIALSGTSWALASGTHSMTIKHTASGKMWRYGMEVTGVPPTILDAGTGKTFNFTKITWFINSREEL